jgi:hypothetical protein
MKTMLFSVLSMALLGLCAPTHAGRVLVDFGRNDVATGGNQGAVTPSPDVNGNTWNNFNKEAFNSNTGSLDVPETASISGLVNVANNATTIGIQLLDSTANNEWEANGAANGGLTSPSPALLGDLAIETATRDYFFTTQASASFVLNGLNPLATYDLRFFGTRDNAGVRSTQYRATGGNGAMLSAVLQTSGAGSGSAGHPNGNDDTTVSVLGLVPNGSNAITVDMLTIAGGFSYIGILEITDHTVPEPGAVILTGLAGVSALSLRSRHRRLVA